MPHEISDPELHQKYRENFLQTLELMELGIALKRQTLVRENPQASEQNINEHLNSWINELPKYHSKNSEFTKI
jgi:hypothetical protein